MELENPALQSEDETLYMSGLQILIDEKMKKEEFELPVSKTNKKSVTQDWVK